jgi:hypothetical protein
VERLKVVEIAPRGTIKAFLENCKSKKYITHQRKTEKQPRWKGRAR